MAVKGAQKLVGAIRKSTAQPPVPPVASETPDTSRFVPPTPLAPPPVATHHPLFSSSVAPAATPSPEKSPFLKHVLDVLGQEEGARGLIERLPGTAQEGLYILLRQAVPSHNLLQFLNNPMLSVVGGAGRVLHVVTMMYERGIHNIRSAFMPSGTLDQLFLSEHDHRINALMAECEEAIAIAARPGTHTVSLSSELAIDWSKVTPQENEFLRAEVLPHLQDKLRNEYQDQKLVNADIVARNNGVGVRLVEVKRILGRFNLSAEGLAKLQLQIVRHALVVRQNGMSGIEYVIRGNDVSRPTVLKLEETLKLTRVPYLIRVEAGPNSYVLEGGLPNLAVSTKAPEARTRELPPLPILEDPTVLSARRATPRDVKAVGGGVADNSWTTEMHDVLISWFSTRNRATFSGGLSTLFDQMKIYYSKCDMQNVMRNIDDYFRKTGSLTAEQRVAVDSELSTLRPLMTGRLTRGIFNSLIRLVTIVAKSPPAPDAAQMRMKALALNQRVIEQTLDAYAFAMDDALEMMGLLEDSRVLSDVEFARQGIEEVSPERSEVITLDGKSLNIPQALRVIAETSGQLQWNVDAEKWTARLSKLEAAPRLLSEAAARIAALPPPLVPEPKSQTTPAVKTQTPVAELTPQSSEAAAPKQCVADTAPVVPTPSQSVRGMVLGGMVQEGKGTAVTLVASVLAQFADALWHNDWRGVQQISAKSLVVDGAVIFGTSAAAETMERVLLNRIPQTIFSTSTRTLGVTGLKLGTAAAFLQLLHSNHVSFSEVMLNMGSGIAYQVVVGRTIGALDSLGLRATARFLAKTPTTIVLSAVFMFGMQQVHRKMVEAELEPVLSQARTSVMELLQAEAKIREAQRQGIAVEPDAIAKVHGMMRDYVQQLRALPDADEVMLYREHMQELAAIHESALDASVAAMNTIDPTSAMSMIEHTETVDTQREHRKFAARLEALHANHLRHGRIMPSVAEASEYLAEPLVNDMDNNTEASSNLDELLAHNFFGLAAQLEDYLAQG